MKQLNLPQIFISLHLILPAILAFITLINLSSNLIIPYLALTIVITSQLVFSSHSILGEQKSIFLYLFGLLVSLGCWFKYSIYSIFPQMNFPEPIGSFQLGSSQESTVLWVSTIGITGILSAQLLYDFYIKKHKFHYQTESIQINNQIKPGIIILLITIGVALINLKYNILLFALKPDIQLPFKGNVFFFLFMTRGLPFLFLFFCLRKFNLVYIALGSIVFSIFSIGVLSRMGIFVYFFTIFFLVICELPNWNVKKILKNIGALAVIFSISTYLCVSLSTGAREFFFNKNKKNESIQKVTDISMNEILVQSNKSDNLTILKKLALGRWIGVEGVMAVNSYPNKGYDLLFNALLEKSYKGNSFYSSISSKDPESINTSNVIVTSVPGPIAFFYYSNSYILIFFALLISSLFYVFTERFLASIFPMQFSSITFITIALTMDFYQFGISPIAFTKYLFFTLFSVIIFRLLIKLKSHL